MDEEDDKNSLSLEDFGIGSRKSVSKSKNDNDGFRTAIASEDASQPAPIVSKFDQFQLSGSSFFKSRSRQESPLSRVSSLRLPELTKSSIRSNRKNAPSEEIAFHPKHALFSISETFFATHESLPAIKQSTALEHGSKPKSHKNVYKETIYKLLHRPTGLAFLYHLLFVSLIITSCVSLNVRQRPDYKEEVQSFNKISDHSFAAMTLSMKTIDAILSVILIVEIVLRLWSSSYKPRYSTMLGKVLYFYDFLQQRMLDFFGIVTFSGYICFQSGHGLKLNDKLYSIEIAIRFAHLIQILQCYRVLFLLFRPLRNTISDQMSQLLLALFGMTIVVIICAFLLYAIERDEPKSQLKTIFDTCWLSFVTFSTIGYGDMIPYLQLSKFILCALGLTGVIMFYLPSHIIGNGLSLALREQRRITFKYLSTAELIRIAITNQQIPQSKSYTGGANNQRSQLLTGHIANSAKKIQSLNQSRNIKINYKNLTQHDHHNHYHDEQEEEELWNKLLLIKDKTSGFEEQRTKAFEQFTEGGATFGEDLNEPSPHHRQHHQHHPQNNQHHHKTHKTESRDQSDRIFAYFQCMDLNRYSNDNAILWYNLNLIEEDIAEMDELINLKITDKLRYIRRQCKQYRKLVNYDNDFNSNSSRSNNNNCNNNSNQNSSDNSTNSNSNQSNDNENENIRNNRKDNKNRNQKNKFKNLNKNIFLLAPISPTPPPALDTTKIDNYNNSNEHNNKDINHHNNNNDNDNQKPQS